jgi:uncharacterized protein (TIGR00304 family)
MDAGTLYGIGITLLFAGTVIVTVAILMLLFSKRKNKVQVRGGGAIIIGPVPIVFGTDKRSLKAVLILSIILTVILIVATVILHLTSQ